MFNRLQVRRWLAWVGVGVGFFGLIGYALSVAGPISRTWDGRRLDAGHGAIAVHWLATNAMPVEQLPKEMDGWRWIPWCDERDHPANNSWRFGRLIVPYWVFVLIGLAAAYRLMPEGFPRGRCRQCGYDLRGIPAVDRVVKCPECGERGER